MQLRTKMIIVKLFQMNIFEEKQKKNIDETTLPLVAKKYIEQ